MKKRILSLVTLALASFSIGQTFQQQNTNIPISTTGLSRISIPNPNTSWITFYDGAGSGLQIKNIGTTSNGGATWNIKTISGIPSNSVISDIEGIDANKAWVVTAPYSNGVNANGLWKTTNGGATWTKTPNMFPSNASFANIIHFWDDNTGIVIGDPLNDVYEMYKTVDGGNSWTKLNTAPIPDSEDEYGYTGGRVSFEDHLWLTSTTGKILYTADRGLTWESFYAPITDFGGESSSASLAFSSPTYGLLVDSNTVLWNTLDSGNEWEVVETTNYYNGNIAYIPGSNNTFITTGIGVESILGLGAAYSNDGGITWNTIDRGIQRGHIGAYDCNTIWVGDFTTDAIGTGGILKLTGEIPGCTLSTTNLNASKVELKAVIKDGTLNVISNKEIKEVLVGDLTGKIITKVNAKEVNVSALKPGVYFARVAYVDNAFGTVKFIVK